MWLFPFYTEQILLAIALSLFKKSVRFQGPLKKLGQQTLETSLEWIFFISIEIPFLRFLSKVSTDISKVFKAEQDIWNNWDFFTIMIFIFLLSW